MPIEYVRGSGSPNGDDEAEVLVKVAWGEELVQVATVARDRATHETLNVGDYDSWYVTVDRRSINDLIRRLRQARDRAYGRDE